MALSSTMYRFKVKLSDVDRGIYDTLELRVARHPSESVPFLLTRVLAYLMNVQEGLEFSKGIAATDEPSLFVKDLTGLMLLWIDIGNPAARRLHKATKAAKSVRVYTFRDVALMSQELAGTDVYRVEEIEFFSLAPNFINRLGETLDRDNPWELLHSDGELTLTCRDVTVQGELKQHKLHGRE